MMDHDTCEAGVAYETMKGMPFEKRPCFCKPGEQPRTGCELMLLPTAEEIEAEDREMTLRFERTMKCRAAIVAHLGGPWKRGMGGKRGEIACPACESGTLRFTRSGYNGHIHAACSTEGCVSWME